MNARLACTALLLVAVASEVRGEHRAALLIDNGAHKTPALAAPAVDLPALAASLEARGFRCESHTGLEDAALKATLEGFAARTPTCGTTLVYFHGKILPGAQKGKSAPLLLGVSSGPGKGYPLADALRALSARGGSRVNLVLVSAAEPLEVAGEEGVLLAHATAADLIRHLNGSGDVIAAVRSQGKAVVSQLPAGVAVTGRGSAAISPPDKFVPGQRAGDEWVNSRGMVFCWCPPGSYTAGSPLNTPGRYDDETERSVSIPQGFWISKYELTTSQWLANRPGGAVARHKLEPQDSANQSKDGGRLLATINTADWNTGQLPKDWEYAIPSEDQWEYAARAGTGTARYFGDDLMLLPKHANFGDRSYYRTQDIFSTAGHRTLDDGSPRLAEVGLYTPNPWGLHDVYGNVAEWCRNGAIRGGSWVSTAETCRSAFRQKLGDRDSDIYIGFRLIIQQKSKSKP